MNDSVVLSIVLTGRNDNYGGDFTQRLVRTLRFNWAALAERGVSCEVVFIEWNPIGGRPFLVDLARAALPEIPAPAFTAYIVDARYQRACTLNPALDYLEYLAKNAGIRRARGRSILVTNTDIFLGRGVVDTLAGPALEQGLVYRAARIDLAVGSDQTRVTWETLEDPSAHARQSTLRPPLFTGASGDFLLLDRDSWHQLRGFNEVYRGARLGIDHNFLVKANGCGYRIVDIGGPVYHVNHPGSYRISKAIVQGADAEAAWGKRGWHSRHVVYDNPDDWGLARAPARQLPHGVTMIDFDWNAVPKIVNLRGVVLPIRRAGSSAHDDTAAEGGAPPAP
jgi:hypothetical protein